MNTPLYRTARALYPHRPDLWEPEFLYEPLPPVPDDHPELALFGDASHEGQTEGETVSLETGAVAGPTSKAGGTPPSLIAGKVRPPGRLDEPMPARMLNEFVYCPRLFFYEYVEGVFVESEDTERGSAIHKKVDKGRGDLAPAKKRADAAKAAREDTPDGSEVADSSPEQTDESGEKKPATDIVHSRSATLGSDRLGVLAKMDLIEVELGREPEPVAVRSKRAKTSASGEPDLFSSESASETTGAPTSANMGMMASRGVRVVQRVTPVDYKAGAPKAGEDGNDLWDADKMQLGLQILILRDNGYVCEEGVIYYRATKQRVSLMMTPELETWVIEKIAEARAAAVGSIPPPLVNSPKCVRCSLAPVCLPDETRMLARGITLGDDPGKTGSALSWNDLGSSDSEMGRRTLSRLATPPRRLIAARDDSRALYLNTQGVRVTLRGEVLVVKEEGKVLGEFRTQDVSHVALFGNIQITTQAIRWLCEEEIPVAYFSMGGWFYGLMRGHGLKNVFTRIEQFQSAQDERRCLALAQRFVHGKIRNHRTQIMRNHVNLPEVVSLKLKRAAGDVLNARNMEELLGMEGAAAALYFQHFAGMIKVEADDDELPGLEPPTRAQQPDFTFDFTKRTRRPPTDPVNALLSLAYSLLAKDCTLAALAVGFDPYVGFYHQPRFGRPALALDLMEEFRPIIAESAVLTALNNRMVNLGHFVQAGDAVNLTSHGRKAFFQAYEQRMNSLVTHPVFDYKASYRRVLELQARMLARYLTGEIAEYVPMMTR